MRRRALTYGLVVLASALVLGGWRAAPAAAQTSGCPDASPTYMTPCGPLVALPQWSSEGGWDGAPYASTIQAGDLNGDGASELLGRGQAGLYVESFDAAGGQWELIPQDLTANGYQTTVLGTVSDAAGWSQPQYYSTIQTAQLTGPGSTQVIARSVSGLEVFVWNPSTNTFTPTGRPLAATADPLFTAPQYYSTIQTADLNGDGTDEVLVRGPNGLTVYDWSASPGGGWTILDQEPTFSDAGGWNQPQFYSTIQTADLDGNGTAELLAVTPNGLGLVVYEWNQAKSSFVQIPLNTPLLTESYWSDPQYYSTIQTGNIDGQPGDELIARTPDGLIAWKYYKLTPEFLPVNHGAPLAFFSDGAGFNEPQSYSTIQTGNVDPQHPGNELLARGPGGIDVFAYDAASDSWTQTVSSSPQLSDPVWTDPGLYGTIQTANVDGLPGDELIARGPYGIRTWTWSPSGWARPQPYGFPAFTGEEATAYQQLNTTFLHIEQGTVRDAYASNLGLASAADGCDTLCQYQQDLVETCQNSQEITTNPPTYASCAPPAGVTVSTQAWTAVANEIIAELFWAQETSSYFDLVESETSDVLITQGLEVQTLVSQLQLQEAENSANVSDLAAFEEAFDLVGELVGTFEGADEIAAAIESTGDAWGAAVDASPIPSGLSQKTVTNVMSDVLTNEQTLQKTVQAEPEYAVQDYGLMRAIGSMYYGQILTFNGSAMQSAAQEGFTLGLYQAFLPTFWAKYVVKGCRKHVGAFYTDECDVPSSGSWMESRSGDDFTAILDSTKSSCWQSGDQYWRYYNCQFGTPPETLADIIWQQPSANCTYTPGTGNGWSYGCSLGASPSEMFNNEAGWNFATYFCSPGSCSSSAARRGGTISSGLALTGSGSGSMTLVGSMPGAGPLHLAGATVSIERLLFDESVGDYVGHPSGGRLLPLALSLRSARGTRDAVFATQSGAGPKAQLLVSQRGTDVTLRLSATGLRMDGVPCAAGAADLKTRIVLTEANGDTLVFQPTGHWTCRARGGAQTLTISRNA